MMSLRFWNEFASINTFEIDSMLLGSEFTIEDGKVTRVTYPDGEVISE